MFSNQSTRQLLASSPLAFKPHVPQYRYSDQVEDIVDTEECTHEDEVEEQISYSGNSMASDSVTPALEGFPDVEKFDQLMKSYTLSSVKTLITSNDAERIRMVLLNPEDTSIKSANFRRWVKKSFTLSNNQIPKNKTLIYRKETLKLIVIKEKLFEILTEAHQQCQHGSQRKTLAQARMTYSKIPEMLVQQYIKICPTCSPVLSEPPVPALEGFPNVIEFDKRMASYIKHLPDEFRDKATISWSMAGKIGKTLLGDTTEPVEFQVPEELIREFIHICPTCRLKFTERSFVCGTSTIATSLTGFNVTSQQTLWQRSSRQGPTTANASILLRVSLATPSFPILTLLEGMKMKSTTLASKRCGTKEKTFFRNDSFAKHMRLFHPEVDWPDKRKCKSTYS
ncbi:predicted protein [Histoplasma capsulatum G186AR]|uniref:Integrase zinc-binding domain-containing protein n=1 Tax=Ajellomyces capsulatus (strain G186AR / H82 / ATCC MYA-2454 / RMSCC 2432) TaxID=447093 RepID=C0NPT0_AJECG|nr:uncharacterized protein HCBG_05160 [Histoplasma capsulatum G186AR]EEH06940.1 predicted protein [Histoplasma capsulatum G186AR]